MASVKMLQPYFLELVDRFSRNVRYYAEVHAPVDMYVCEWIIALADESKNKMSQKFRQWTLIFCSEPTQTRIAKKGQIAECNTIMFNHLNICACTTITFNVYKLATYPFNVWRSAVAGAIRCPVAVCLCVCALQMLRRNNNKFTNWSHTILFNI